MHITKGFRIQEVKAQWVTNAPFKIVLGQSIQTEGESYLTLDTSTCTRLNIPMSLELVGRTLICFLESRELPRRDNGHFIGGVDMESLGNDDLVIHSLKRSEVVSPSFGMLVPSWHSKVSRILELSSIGAGDGIHPSPLRCPFYRIVLELSEGGYEACKVVLPSTTVFKVSFRLV